MKDIALYEAGLSGYIGDTDAYTAQAVYGNINDLHSCYMPLPTVQKDGYVFDGWYTKRVGGKKVAEGNSYYDVSGLKGQQKVYAHWIKDSDPAQSIFCCLNFFVSRKSYLTTTIFLAGWLPTLIR